MRAPHYFMTLDASDQSEITPIAVAQKKSDNVEILMPPSTVKCNSVHITYFGTSNSYGADVMRHVMPTDAFKSITSHLGGSVVCDNIAD